MAQPPRYQRTKDFGADYPDQTDNQAINNELDAVAATTDGLRKNLAKIQRDDGGLRDGIVTKDALAQPLKQELYDEFSQNVTAAVQTAQQAAGDANTAAIAAEASATSAATSADAAAGSLATIAGAVDSTTASAAAASASAIAAAASETNAATSASQALASKNAAATSETNAGTAANAAALSATSASDSKDAAALSQAAAATSETNAATSETNAAASASSASNSADRAEAAVIAEGWMGLPIGMPFPVAYGASLPPTDDPAFRYVLLTAGMTGAGAYNEGILTGETVTGSAPLIEATATISLAGSPLNGITIHLINTEKRFVGAGASEAFENDSLQNIYGGLGYFVNPSGVSPSSTGAFTNSASQPSSDGGPNSRNYAYYYFNAANVARVDDHTQPRAHRAPHLMRIL